MNEATMTSTHNDKTYFGFWTYLMTDIVLFATLFATYAILKNGVANGPSSHQIIELPFVLIETVLLLTSSFASGLALLAARAGKRQLTALLLMIVFALGAGFVAMELSEFAKLAHEGHGWQVSAFLSAFFTLVGTHGLHITAGLLWIIVLSVQLMRFGLSNSVMRRLTLFTMFWHFLDVVWIAIFTIVYLMGSLA